MAQNILHQYNAPLVSREVNKRFSDFMGGSILAGFRFVMGSTPNALSLVKDTDASSVVVTWIGDRVEETTDLVDILTLSPNVTATDRLDSIYVVHTHGEPITAAIYVVIDGDNAGNAAASASQTTHTLLGYVRVLANNAPLTSGCFLPNPVGLVNFQASSPATFHNTASFENNVTMQAKLTLTQHPLADWDATTKAYVDAVALGLSPKDAVRATTTGANITLSGIQTIDGVALVAGDRILVRHQTIASQNGIYVVANGAWARAADADNISTEGLSEVKSGMFCMVSEGAQFISCGFMLQTFNPIVLNTTNLVFIQFSSAGLVQAGTGLSKTGNTLSLATGVVPTGTYRSVTVDTYGRVVAGTAPTTIAEYGLTDAQPMIMGGASTITSANLNPSFALMSDGSGKVVVSAVTATELGYVSGVTSSLQAQLNAKQDPITGGASTVTLTNLGVSSALASNAGGKIVVSPTTAIELGYVSGVTSPLQAQIDSKIATSALSAATGASLISISAIAGITGLNVQQALQGIKDYTDALKQGLDPKDSVRASTNGTNITLSGTQTIDSVALNVGDRVLVKDQTTVSQNGIYVVAAIAWARSTDADTSAKVSPGLHLFIEEGATLANAEFVLTTPNPIVLGTTGLTFTQLTGLGTVTAGAGLTRSGNVMSLLSGIVAPGTYRSLTVDTYGRATAGTTPTTIAGYGLTDAQQTITGAATTITSANLSANKALASDVNGKVAASAVTSTELGQLSGVTSPIQPQIAGKANAVHTHDDSDIKDYQVYASNQDATSYVYKTAQFKRTADNTLYLQSILSNPDAYGHYQTVTMQYYDAAGTAVVSTKTWTLTYDTLGGIVSKIVA